MKKVVATNRKAKLNYEILETLEAGIALKGSEVKSIREGRIDISEGYITVENGEAIMHSVHISPYSHSSEKDYDPKRPRKLLLHKKEIHRLLGQIQKKGLTAIPLSVYFVNNKWAKVEIGVARGKKLKDRREEIKRRDLEREMKRERLK